MSNQLPGCDSCYGNTPLFEGEKLHVNQVGRTLRIVDYPLDGDTNFVESFYLRMNFCPNCGHEYEVRTIQEGWNKCLN